MKKNLTQVSQNDLIRLAYGEASATEAAHLRQRLLEDPQLKAAYDELLGMQSELDKAIKKPRKGFLNRLFKAIQTESDSLQSV